MKLPKDGIIKHGALVFDIGAHFGESIDKFSKHYGAGKVISVEPHWQNYLEIVKNIREKGYPATALHAAVWHEPTILGVCRCESQTGLTTVQKDRWQAFYPDQKFGVTFDIATITIDMMKAKYGLPQYVKVDTEGSEYECLRGMTFKSEFLSFEFHGTDLMMVLKCIDRCVELGYTKGSWVEEDVALDWAPDMPILGMKAKFKNAPPRWGNITVS